MAQALFYSSNAVAMTLAAGIASGDTTCNLSSTSGLPASFPFKLLIGWGTAQQEVVHCTALSGVVATITRGQDGTTAQAHSIGATVVHGVSAREFNDLELHVGSTAAVHGITGSVVGTSDTQSLTNKTFDATSTVSGAPIVGTTTAQTLTNKTLVGVAVNPAATNSVGLTVQALALQTAALQEWKNSAGTVLMGVLASGFLQAPNGLSGGAVTNTTGSWRNAFGSTASGEKAMVVIGAPGQATPLQEWQNNSGTPVASIDQNGNIAATNLTSAWTAYTPTFTNITSGGGVFRYLAMGKTMFIRGTFTAGTVTANGTIAVTTPAASASGVAQLVAGQVGTGPVTWVASPGLASVGTSASLTAGTGLTNAAFSGTIELA